jgi:predicted DNA-binding WGR domain protein
VIHWRLAQEVPMQAEIAIALRAENPARNVRRAWRAEAGTDLFGMWLVQTRFGRIGTEGRVLARSFADEAGARAYLAASLRRRAGAVRRIGVAYQEVVLD